MKGMPREDLFDLLSVFPEDAIIPLDYVRGLYKSYGDTYAADKENGFYKVKSRNKHRKEMLTSSYEVFRDR